jgi:hypothetical protein
MANFHPSQKFSWSAFGLAVNDSYWRRADFAEALLGATRTPLALASQGASL